MKKLLLVVICLLGMAMTVSAETKSVKVDELQFEVESVQAEEIEKAAWAHAFRLEDGSNRYGDSCHTGFVGTDYYICSPDMRQEYLVRPSGLKRVANPEGLRYEDDWGDYGYGQAICYIFGYDNDNVYVVIYGK